MIFQKIKNPKFAEAVIKQIEDLILQGVFGRETNCLQSASLLSILMFPVQACGMQSRNSKRVVYLREPLKTPWIGFCMAGSSVPYAHRPD
jgi:hypothetical protein